MPRVKRGTIGLKRRREILRKAKGYRFARSKKEGAAREALAHAGHHAFAHRRDKKNVFRRNWQVEIGAALQQNGRSYSKVMGGLRKKGILLNRKMLALIAREHPETFSKIVESV